MFLGAQCACRGVNGGRGINGGKGVDRVCHKAVLMRTLLIKTIAPFQSTKLPLIYLFLQLHICPTLPLPLHMTNPTSTLHLPTPTSPYPNPTPKTPHLFSVLVLAPCPYRGQHRGQGTSSS